jgi:hypothetical protein
MPQINLGASGRKETMVAMNNPAARADTSAESEGAASQSSVKRLVLSLTRLVNIQLHLVLLRTKYTVRKILMAAALFAAAGVVATLAIIFLYIGVFELLCLAMRPMWAFILLGGVHLVIAALLIITGKAMLSGDSDPSPMNPPECTPEPVADEQEYTYQEQESPA